MKLGEVFGNVMEYGYQGINPGSKVQYLLNSIRYDKLSTAVAKVWMHSGRYEKDFSIVVMVASNGQNRPAKQQRTSTTHGTLKGKMKLKKYSREEYDSMSMAQHQQLY